MRLRLEPRGDGACVRDDRSARWRERPVSAAHATRILGRFDVVKDLAPSVDRLSHELEAARHKAAGVTSLDSTRSKKKPPASEPR